MRTQRIDNILSLTPVAILALVFASSVMAAGQTTAPTKISTPSEKTLKTTAPTPVSQVKPITPNQVVPKAPTSKAFTATPPVRKLPANPARTAPKTISSKPKPKNKIKVPSRKPAVSTAVPKSPVSKPSAADLRPGIKTFSVAPPVLGRKSATPVNIAPGLDRSKQDLGSAGVDMDRRKDLGVPGHSMPGGGIGSRSGASDYTKGIGQRDGVGSVKDEFSDQMGPTIKIGAGAQKQGQETDDDKSKNTMTREQVILLMVDQNEAGEDVIKSERGEFVFGDVNDLADQDLEYMTGVDINGDGQACCRDKNGKIVPPPTKEERTADGGPGENDPDGIVDPGRIKSRGSVITGGPQVVPGEEAGEGGISPGDFHDLGPSQVHTFDDGSPSSNKFEDLNKQLQKTIIQNGPAIKEENPVLD